MHLRAGRWARRALPSLSPLSRALAPDAATPHAGRSEATTEGSRAGPGPQPPGFADGWREEPPLAARTPVLPAALLAASKASKGTGGGCAVFAPGVLACPGRSQVARGVTAKGVLYNPAHSRSSGQPARDAHSAQQLRVECRQGPPSLEAAPLCPGFRCVGLSCVACWAQTWGSGDLAPSRRRAGERAEATQALMVHVEDVVPVLVISELFRKEAGAPATYSGWGRGFHRFLKAMR